MNGHSRTICFASAIAIVLASLAPASGQRDRWLLPNEQGRIQHRSPRALRHAPLPNVSRPPTVSSAVDLPEWRLSLDEAINQTLQNTDVVRVLSGTGAASSGFTIYSPGISNTAIDEARAFLDPIINVRNNFLRNESPSAGFDLADPNRAIINGSRSDTYDFSLGVTKQTLGGAVADLNVATNRIRTQPGSFPLNPQSTSAVDMSLSQPLLRGRGTDVNSVPIVLAFLDTERSYFQLKSALQGLVLGVIQGYWDLVQARTELWVLEQQIRQVEFTNELSEARFPELDNIGQVSQTRASMANFRANLVATKATILNRVATLRGILGLPPGNDFTIVPTTPPVTDSIDFDWDALIALAAERRPDLVELKLVLEADRQRILLARNQSLPQLDASALYRWNGLEGEMPIGDRIAATPSEHTDWSLGVTFSVPFTLRAERANLRRNELLLASDEINLQQGLLEASHSIAFQLRTLDQLSVQYKSFQEARTAAETNLELQLQQYEAGITNFLEVLLAINTWGDSVTSEARSVTQFNAALANLELETGTILETHGVRLFEERYCSIGPLGCRGQGREYPAAIRPTSNSPRYENGDRPAEEAFNLTTPKGDERSKRLPPPEPTRESNGE